MAAVIKQLELFDCCSYKILVFQDVYHPPHPAGWVISQNNSPLFCKGRERAKRGGLAF